MLFKVTSSDLGYNDSGFIVGSLPTSPTSDEEYLSDYIQNHRVPLPHLSAEDSGAERNLNDEFTSIASNGTAESDWQENWLFKKSSLNSQEALTNPIAHIGMLVPSPTEDVKAQIGDQTTDEISDLSEAGSDVESELSDTEPDASLPSVLQPASLVLQSSPIQEAKNELVQINLNGSHETIKDFNQIELSEEEIQKSLETLDAVVNAAEKAELQSAIMEDVINPIIRNAIEKTTKIIDENQPKNTSTMYVYDYMTTAYFSLIHLIVAEKYRFLLRRKPTTTLKQTPQQVSRKNNSCVS